MKLTVIIPAYNEEATIEQLLKKVFDAPIGIDKEIIVVDDGSTDATAFILEKYKNRARIIKHSVNKGKGSAIRTGLEYASGDLVVIQDGDLEYDPNNFQKLIEPIVSGEADAVFGSRNLNAANQRAGNIYYLGGIALTWLANLLFNINITDEPTCYKLFKTEIIKNLNLKCKRFEFCPEVTAKIAKRGYRIVEIPISYYPRTVAEGKKINWLDGIQAVWTLVKYRFYE